MLLFINYFTFISTTVNIIFDIIEYKIWDWFKTVEIISL